MNRREMQMTDWVKKLDGFLTFNEKNILTHAGKISAALAEERAHKEFDKYEAKQRQLEAANPTSDFDKAIEDMNLKKLPSAKSKRKKKDKPDNPPSEGSTQ